MTIFLYRGRGPPITERTLYMLTQTSQYCYTGQVNENIPVETRVSESIQKNSLPFLDVLKERFAAVVHDFFEGDKKEDFKGIDCVISIFNFDKVGAALRVRHSKGTIGVSVRKTEPKHLMSPDCPRLIIQHNTNSNTIYICDAKMAYKLAKAIFSIHKPGIKNVRITPSYRYFPQHNDNETYVELSEDYLKRNGALIASVQLHRPIDELDLEHLL